MSSTSDQPREAGRPRWWVAGLSLCLVLGGGVLAWSLTREDTYLAPAAPSVGDRPSVDAAGATEALAALQRALRSGDRDAAEGLAPADDPAATRLLGDLVANATRTRLTDVTLRYVDDEGAPDAEGRWEAAVDVSWRFRGFDATSANAEVRAHLVDDGDRVAITGFGGGGEVSPVWLSGPVQVRRSDATLVLVAGAAGASAAADRYAARARAAVPVVRRVLPQWRRGLVVEVPGSARALERTLAGGRGSYDQIAAVTTSADGSQVADAPVHVFVNPDVFGGLRRTGAQVVMSHEATHVAAGAWDSRTPLWLLEGFADYVALRDVPLPLERSAAQIIAEVRRDGPPSALPDAAAFGARTPHLGATYESAWLACRLIAQLAGEPALVAFYRAVDGGAALGPALRASTGVTLADLTAAWRSQLSILASGGDR